MATIKPVELKLSEKLRDREYFHGFFEVRAQAEIPIQIRALMGKRELTQVQFGELCGMKQSAASRVLSEDYSAWNFKTLLRIARALDARLKVEFIPMEEVIAEYERSDELVGRTESSPTSGPNAALDKGAAGASQQEMAQGFRIPGTGVAEQDRLAKLFNTNLGQQSHATKLDSTIAGR